VYAHKARRPLEDNSHMKIEWAEVLRDRAAHISQLPSRMSHSLCRALSHRQFTGFNHDDSHAAA
jgi:hypothetical protein